MRKFLIRIDNFKPKTLGKLWYIEDEYSIFFQEKYQYDRKLVVSLLIDTLSLLVSDQDKRIVYVHGYFPHTAWINRRLPNFSFIEGAIYINDNDFDPNEHVGVGYEISKNWNKYYDNISGYVFVGNNYNECLKCIEFCSNCYISIKHGYINGLWLKPKIIPTFPE